MDIHELPVPSPEGYRYLADFIDDASRLWVLAPLKRKSEAFEALKVYVAHAERQTGCKVLCVHDDKDGEWMSNAEKFWCQEHGIRVEHTMRNEPHQNGVAERPWRTLSSGIVAMLKDSGLGQQWWVYCAMAFCHVHNRSANAALKGRTPWLLQQQVTLSLL